MLLEGSRLWCAHQHAGVQRHGGQGQRAKAKLGCLHSNTAPKPGVSEKQNKKPKICIKSLRQHLAHVYWYYSRNTSDCLCMSTLLCSGMHRTRQAHVLQDPSGHCACACPGFKLEYRFGSSSMRLLFCSSFCSGHNRILSHLVPLGSCPNLFWQSFLWRQDYVCVVQCYICNY